MYKYGIVSIVLIILGHGRTGHDQHVDIWIFCTGVANVIINVGIGAFNFHNISNSVIHMRETSNCCIVGITHYGCMRKLNCVAKHAPARHSEHVIFCIHICNARLC